MHPLELVLYHDQLLQVNNIYLDLYLDLCQCVCSTNQKLRIYRKLYENTSPQIDYSSRMLEVIVAVARNFKLINPFHAAPGPQPK